MQSQESIQQRLPAEWAPQDAVLLAWPHKNTEWNQNLNEMEQLYEALVSVICDYADLVIALPELEIERVKARLQVMDIPLEYVYFYAVDTNDTWARDFGPLSVMTSTGIKLLDFIFNAWGEKYPGNLDNQVTQTLFAREAFPAALIEPQDWVLEGGSIDVDGQGALLTTSACLLNKNRNPNLTKNDIELRLKDAFGVTKIHWLNHGVLQGDDTDGHIDTLARFCPNNTIVYVACDDEQDDHFVELKKMEQELQSLTNIERQPYRLLPLPWAGAIYGEQNQRVPASYANFLIVNEAVLVPIYDALSDEDALEVISTAFPGYEVFGIPCLSLIERGGSLHCITMQLPEGVLFHS
jgi:agmatine deiminase